MKIEKNKFVSLIYELREGNQDGRILEVVEENRPMNFIYGSGRLLPHFESALIALQKGDPFSFVLGAESAYGGMSEDMIINISVSVFETDGKKDDKICRVGNIVPMMDREGNRINGTIIEITDTYVKMDFNHPLSGIDLFFSGKIVDVREASKEELSASMNTCEGCSSNSSSGCSGSCN